MRFTPARSGFFLVLLVLESVSVAAPEAEDPVFLLDVPVRVEDGDGQPLAGARVQVTGRQRFESNVDGHFMIYNVAHSARLTFAIELAGYQAVQYRDLTVPHDGFRFVLEPGIAIRGRVVDEAGESLAGVRIFSRSPYGHGTDLEPVDTDADGRFVLADASEGTLRLTALADGGIAECVELQLHTGHDEEVLFVMQPAFALSGQVTDPEGQPVVGASVKARLDRPGAGRPPSDHRYSDEDGFFRCRNLPVGTYRVSAVHPEFETVHDVVTIDDDVDVELRFTERRVSLGVRGGDRRGGERRGVGRLGGRAEYRGRASGSDPARGNDPRPCSWRVQ